MRSGAVSNHTQEHTRAKKERPGRGGETREREREQKVIRERIKMGKKSSSAIASIFISCVHGSSSSRSSSTDVDKVRLVCSVLRIFNEAQSVEKRKKKSFRYFYFYEWVGDSTL